MTKREFLIKWKIDHEELEELLNDYNIYRKIWECKQCHHHNSQIEINDEDE